MAADAPAAFFSYSREDSEFALRLAEDLKAAGGVVWIDQLDIAPGQEWDNAIEDAVTQCPRMLLILSAASVKSPKVRNEIAFALDEKKTIIPVLYQDCTVPLQLRRIQHIDFRTDHTRGLKVLLKALGVEQSVPRPANGKEFFAGWSAATAVVREPALAPKAPLGEDARAAESRRSEPRSKALTLRELRTLTGHAGSVWAVAVTLGGKVAVSGSSDGTLKVWELAMGCELRTLTGHTHYVYGVAVTPDGQRAVSASFDDTVKLWNLETGEVLATFTGHSEVVYAVAVTPDGRRAVSGSQDQTLKVWDLASGRELRTLTGHSRWVRAAAVTPDGQRAVSASDDQTLKVWDLASGRELRTLTGHAGGVNGVAVTPDGLCAVSASEDRTLKVWDLGTGREMRTLTGHEWQVNAVAVTPDGRYAVSASDDQTLKVWDLHSGHELASFEAHASLRCCAVCPDEKSILAGDYNGLIHVLRLE